MLSRSDVLTSTFLCLSSSEGGSQFAHYVACLALCKIVTVTSTPPCGQTQPTRLTRERLLCGSRDEFGAKKKKKSLMKTGLAFVWFWRQVTLDTHLRAGTDGAFLLPTEPNWR